MKKIFSLFAAVLMAGSMMAQFDTWSVVGSKAIMNGTADWAISETANDMATEDGVTYTLTVTGKTLEVGTTYEYKYAKGHAWTVSIPQSGNLSLTVTETAVYDIVYTVNVSDQTHTAVATKAGEAGEITHVYSVAGDNATLFGAAWSQTATATEMTKGEDGIYSWTKENVELAAGTIAYKVVVDHAWGEAYPSANASLVIAEAGTYNVVVTFNPADKAVNATATKVGGEPEPGPGPDPEPEPTINYYLAGSMNTPAWGSVAMPGDSIVLNLAAGEHGFKVQSTEGVWDGALTYDDVNAECSSEGIYTNGDRNVMFTLTEAGEVKIKVVEGAICVTGAFEAQEVFNYYIAGTMNSWGSTGMTGDSIVLDLAAGEHKFKVQLVAGYWDNALGYSALNAECSNQGLSTDNDGNVVFTLDEAGQVKLKVVSGSICATGAFHYEQAEPVITYALGASFNAWTAAANPFDGNTITVELEAGTHEFKVVKIVDGEEQWLGYDEIVNTECTQEGVTKNVEYGNIKVVLTAAGSITVTIGEDGKACVSFEQGEEVRKTFTYHAGASAEAGAVFFLLTSAVEGATDETANPTETIKMTAGEGDVFTAQVLDNTLSIYIVRCPAGAESIDWANVWNGTTWVAYAAEYWFAGYNEWNILLSTTIPTDINNIEAGKVVKMIENGHVVILRDGKRYNAVGAQL